MVLQNLIPVKTLGSSTDVVHAREGGANTTSFLAAHFAKRNTKFGGGGQFRSKKFRAKFRISHKSKQPLVAVLICGDEQANCLACVGELNGGACGEPQLAANHASRWLDKIFGRKF